MNLFYQPNVFHENREGNEVKTLWRVASTWERVLYNLELWRDHHSFTCRQNKY